MCWVNLEDHFNDLYYICVYLIAFKNFWLFKEKIVIAYYGVYNICRYKIIIIKNKHKGPEEEIDGIISLEGHYIVHKAGYY